MITLLMIFIILIAVLLMFIILIQSSKGGGLAGTFGGGDASMVFGVRRTADFLIKLTSMLATIYLIFSLITNIIINKGGGTQESIIQTQTGTQTFPQQQVPGQLPPPGENQQPPGQEQPPGQDQPPPK